MEKILFLKKIAPNYAELLIFTVMGVPTSMGSMPRTSLSKLHQLLLFSHFRMLA